MNSKVVVAIFLVLVLGVLLSVFLSRPVLLVRGDNISLLNPFRTRRPEQIADAFLRAASSGMCPDNITEKLCDFVKRRPLPARDWQLVNRLDFATQTRLYYRLSGANIKPSENGGCLIAEVDLDRDGQEWKTSGYVVEPGPCNANFARP